MPPLRHPTQSSIIWQRAILAGVAFFLLALLFTPEIRNDGRYYAGAADSLLAGDGLRYYPEVVGYREHPFEPNQYFTMWPPGMPLIMAGMHGLGFGYVEIGRLINAFSVGIIAILTVLLIGDVPLWVIAAALITTWRIIYNMGLFQVAFSDLLFLGFWGLLLYLLFYYPQRLFLITVIAGWLALLRYIGLAAILAGSICYLLLYGDGWSRRILNAGFFFVGSFVPIGLWFLRNLGHGRPLMGERYIDSHSWGNVFVSFVSIQGDWIVWGVVFSVALLGLFLVLSRLRRNHHRDPAGGNNRRFFIL